MYAGEVLLAIALPLSKAIIAILVLYYSVGHWNAYFSALIYISDKDMYPLQLVLRNILITNQAALAQAATSEEAKSSAAGETGTHRPHEILVDHYQQHPDAGYVSVYPEALC